MRKKKTILLIVQFLLLICAGISLNAYVQNQVKPVQVYVFNKVIEPSTEIGEGDIVKKSIPQEAVTEDFVTNPEDILGKFTSTKVFPNQFVISSLVTEGKNLDPFETVDLSELRKISLPINYVDGFAGNIKRGDTVDLIYTGVGEKETEMGSKEEFMYSKAFLQNIMVFNVATGDGYRFDDHSHIAKGEIPEGLEGEEITTSGDSDEIAVLTLAVTLDQAEEILTRMQSGKVKVVGRFNESESYETLGFVLGEYENVFSGQANVEANERVDIPITNIDELENIEEVESNEETNNPVEGEHVD